MKKVLTLLLLWWAAALPGLGQSAAPALRIEPAQPHPGDKLTVTYDPRGTSLAGAEKVSAQLLTWKSASPWPADIALQQEGGVWRGTVPTTDSTATLLLKFQGGPKEDNNGGKGYVVYLLDQQNEPVPGARVWHAQYLTNPYFNFVEKDETKAFALYGEEFTLHPASRDTYLPAYLQSMFEAKREGYQAQVRKELDALAARKNLSNAQLALLATWYKNVEQPEKANKYAAIVRQKDPKGPFVMMERFHVIYEGTDPARQKRLLTAFAKDFPAQPDLIRSAGRKVVQQYVEKEDLRGADDFLAQFPAAADKHLLNNIAWQLYEKGQHLAEAERYSQQSLELARNDTTPKPPQVDEKQWQETRQTTEATFLDTYGAILAKRGRPEAAYPVLKESVRLLKGNSAEVNERYVSVLVQTKRHQEALAAGDQFIPEGKGTRPMKEDLRQAYIAVNGNEKGYDRYLASLEAPAREKMKKELQQKMISEPAPAFRLQDLKGKPVALADLKGKTVVLDFWATWCGPCVSSMPGMQQAVNKYKDDPTVAFLFINSWQREPNKQQIVGAFLEKKKYDFTVPLDVDNQVIEAYKVDGIPAKFVIDPQGNIRFKSVGFEGGPDALVEELSLMIDLAGGKGQ